MPESGAYGSDICPLRHGALTAVIGPAGDDGAVFSESDGMPRAGGDIRNAGPVLLGKTVQRFAADCGHVPVGMQEQTVNQSRRSLHNVGQRGDRLLRAEGFTGCQDLSVRKIEDGRRTGEYFLRLLRRVCIPRVSRDPRGRSGGGGVPCAGGNHALRLREGRNDTFRPFGDQRVCGGVAFRSMQIKESGDRFVVIVSRKSRRNVL